MSRMTLLDGNLWLSLSAERAQHRSAKAGEPGYPPHNIELLPGGERGPEALRITLAVAGFRPDELEVSVLGPLPGVVIDRSVVDQRIAATEASRDPCRGGHNALIVGDIELACVDIRAVDRSRCRCALRQIARAEHDHKADAGQLPTDLEPDPAVGTGHQRDLASALLAHVGHPFASWEYSL